jgi:hypothetical protein
MKHVSIHPLSFILGMILIGCVGFASARQPRVAEFDEITVRGLRVVNDQGKLVAWISQSKSVVALALRGERSTVSLSTVELVGDSQAVLRLETRQRGTDRVGAHAGMSTGAGGAWPGIYLERADGRAVSVGGDANRPGEAIMLRGPGAHGRETVWPK